MFHKVKRSTTTNFKKGLVKRARDYIESEDQNRKWKDDMISSLMVSRLNEIPAGRTDIINKRKEGSQSIQQLIA
jgi:hypothetical protein